MSMDTFTPVISSTESVKSGLFTRACQYVMSLLKNFRDNIVNFSNEAVKLGKDDPRRVFHALKVGLAITIVSVFYYFQPIYDGFGVNAMWAVITVVVVFEYTVGATLGKGLNRMISTLIAGFLGALAHYVADLSGKIGEPILLALFGFIVASIMTFMRFFPKLKAKYDYGLMIFILTFALVAVSGYRDDEVIKMAQQRFTTVIIGSSIAMLICILISPVWTGTELHNLIASNVEKLGIFLEGFGNEYLKTTDEKAEKCNIRQYKSFLGTKSTEETMANFASWEPSHGKFKFRHPWKQYLKIGALTRQCGYKLDALDNFLNYDNQQNPREIQENVKDACTKLSNELGKVLKEVASGIKKMKKLSSTKILLAETNSSAQELKALFQDTKLWENYNNNLLEILPTATVAFILLEIVECVENLVDGVHELASMANFKSIMESAVVNPEEEIIGSHHVITIDNVGEHASSDHQDDKVIEQKSDNVLNVEKN